MGLEVNRGQSSLSIPNPNSQFPTPKSQPPIHRVVSPPTNKTARGAGGVPTPPSLRIPSSVNVAMAGTGLYQLSRKIRKDYFSDQKDDVASLEG
uniref:Uncharacterized protein n=1 Tax=Oryza meridionalis TaxID=40149 RepID=A0A0E0EKL3_9ORYZ